VSVLAVRRQAGSGETRTLVDRLLAATPLLGVFAAFSFLYAWEAWAVITPWLFTDELEFTQLSRSIAESGQPARRGEPYAWGSLYVVLTAPAWLISDTELAYQVAKYIGVFAMTAVVFPVYGLARMLVSPRPALFAAAGAASIPAFMYSALLIEEPLAYPYAALCFFLAVRALAAPSLGRVLAAVVAAVLAPLVRTQLAILPAVLVLASLGLAWTSARARAWRRSWTRWDWAGAVLLALGAVVVANAVLSQASFSWLVATRAYKERMLEYGLWAGGALTIGLGILPVVAGLALLGRTPGERWTPERRAFVAVFASAVAAFGFYTAVKASYLSTVFATRVAERNLIYLAPLFFVATALWVERRRLPLVPFALASAFVGVLLVVTQLQLEYPYFEAPGFGILAGANRALELPRETIRTVLYVVLALAVVLLALPSLLKRRPRLSAGVVGVAVGLVLAWNVTGQLYASGGSRENAELFLANFPEPPTWLDEATDGAPTVYLGQQIRDPNGIWLIEFWNRSLKKVWSIDGTAPGPGPTLTPDLAKADGSLFPDPETDYVLADAGVDVAGPVLVREGNWRLHAVSGAIKLQSATTGLYSDAWMGAESAYSLFSTPGNQPGTLVVTLSREAWGGEDVPGNVTIRVGTLVIGADHQPHLGDVLQTETGVINAKETLTFRIPTPAPPLRAEVSISPTFSPRDLDPRIGDARQLGAQVSFGFVGT
jgi:hypothetical protein